MVGNAWLDYRQRKPNLTLAMVAFGQALEACSAKRRVRLPNRIADLLRDGLDDASVNAGHHYRLGGSTLARFLHCPPQDRIGHELQQLRQNALNMPDELADFLCSPIELLGIPTLALPNFVKEYVDDETFNKAFFDSVSELPFSIQLQVALQPAKSGTTCEALRI
ncbi:MAG: hypothetical protein V9E91_08310 [Burkholderiaceae bacterium]